MRSTILVCLLLAAACSDSDGPASSTTIDDYIQAWRAEYCDFKVRCGVFPDVETCQMQDRTLAADLDVVAAVHAGFVEFHADVAQECLAALAQRTCDSTTMADRLWDVPCYGTFAGTRHEGEVCALDRECISGECEFPSTLCVDGVVCCSGICKGDVAPPLAMLNESCRAAPCGEGYCNRAQFLCQALDPIGSFCDFDAECAYGSACIRGECTAMAGTGDACAQGPARSCKVTGETCHTASGVCELGQPLRGACTDFWDCSMGDCVEGQCTDVLPKVGESCEILRVCQLPALCENTQAGIICVAPKPDGEACGSDDECESQWCDLGPGGMCSSERCI